jgi:hypothetical protein
MKRNAPFALACPKRKRPDGAERACSRGYGGGGETNRLCYTFGEENGNERQENREDLA